MLKKFTALICAFALCLSIVGCTDSNKPSGGDSVQTSELVPYTAGHKFDIENDYCAQVKYGLMTPDGKTIVEPLYNSYQVFEANGKTYYCMKVMQGDWEPICHNSLLISSDGEFRLEIQDNIVCLSEDRIICQQSEQPFTVYDYSGNKIFSGNQTQSIDTDGNGFYNGLLLVYDFIGENDDTEVRDKNGNLVLGGLDYCGTFETGKAVASYNRDEGYGIITPQGKWLLEPIYTDITDVEGKYFVATKYDTMEIYDSDLKLLKAQPCSPFIEHQYYFFITNSGKLIKHYAHMDSPDNFFYDAFTDEPISCNGVNATSNMHYLGHYYAISDGTAMIMDENDKLLAQHENAVRIEEFDGSYAVYYANGTADYYNGKTHQKMVTLNCGEDWKPVQTVADCGFVAIGDLKNIGDSRADGPYHLFDYKKGEYVFKDCEHCEIKEFNGSVYITVVYGDRVETYDSSLNLLIKTENK